MNKENFLMVSVDMITYGHENHIRQAIEGVLMQETNFEFDLIIADDCSPDNTREIVEGLKKNHPKGNKIKYFRHTENLGMQANSSFAAEQCTGKYTAVCEGDDYWTDPLKLQKQVDFLEANPDFGLCHTGYYRYIQNTNRQVYQNLKFSIKDVFEGLLKGQYPIATLTAIFHTKIWQEYVKEINPVSRNWLMGDLPFWIYLSRSYKVYYLDEVTAAYRVLEESASNTRNIDKMIQFDKSVMDVKLFFLKKYSDDFLKINKIKSEVEAIYIYRKIIAFAKCKGNLRDFFSLILQFHKINKNPRYFLGSFKQIAIRFL